jgi:hypothetical protein
MGVDIAPQRTAIRRPHLAVVRSQHGTPPRWRAASENRSPTNACRRHSLCDQRTEKENALQKHCLDSAFVHVTGLEAAEIGKH